MSNEKPRYLPRHTWYLADALLLVRDLQAIAWPLGWHIALGGGILNHGYSDKDIDLYVLPIYNQEGIQDELTVLNALGTRIQTSISASASSEPVCSLQDNPHECFTYAVRFYIGEKAVEVFVVRRVA